MRSVTRHQGVAYEERITVWRAVDASQAIELAEAEAKEYAEMLGDAKDCGIYQSYLCDTGDRIKQGDEVFSLIRDSSYSPKRYVDRFFDTGTECQNHL